MTTSDLKHQTSLARPVAPATGRIGVVRVYFDISAVLAGIITTAIIVATLLPSALAPGTSTPRPWLAIVGGGLYAWGAAQTSRMLRDRRRSGALTAGFTFAASLVVVGSHAQSWPAVALSLVGLGLVASIWSRLE